MCRPSHHLTPHHLPSSLTRVLMTRGASALLTLGVLIPSGVIAAPPSGADDMRAMTRAGDQERTRSETAELLSARPTWSELKAWVSARSPHLRAARADTRGARANVRAVDRWRNPKVMYRYAPLPIETKRGETPHVFGVSQALSWPDERSAHREVAEAEVALSQATLHQQELEAIRALEEGLWDLWADGERRHALQAQVDHLESLRDDLSGRVESGLGVLSELQEVSLSLAQLNERRRRINYSIGDNRVELGRLLDLSGEYNYPPPPDLIPQGLLDMRSPKGALEKLLGSTTTASSHITTRIAEEGDAPALRQAAAWLRQALAVSERLSVAQRPQIEVGAQWVVVSDPQPTSGQARPADQGVDALIFWIGASLPLWRDADRGAREAASARVEARRAEEREVTRRWRAGLRRATLELEEQRVRISVIRSTLLPTAQALIETLTSEQSTGAVSSRQLYRALLKRDALSLDLIEALRRWGRARAKWRSLSSKRVDEPLELEAVTRESRTR